MSDLTERMRQMVDHYQTEMPSDPLSVEEAVEDAEHFLCDGVGGSCVSLMKRVLELEERLAALETVPPPHKHHWAIVGWAGPGEKTERCVSCGASRRVT